MEKSKKLIDLYLLVLFLLGAISLILRTIACCIEWNDITKHFNDDAVITIANILAVASIGLFATYPLLVKNNEKIASSDTPHSYIPAGMLAVALLFSSFEKLAERNNPLISANATLVALALVTFLLGVASAAFFFLTVFVEKNESVWTAIFGMTLVAFCAISAAYLYFDNTILPTNSPAKIANMMAYLFASMFFLFETRIALGRSIWPAYVTFGLSATLITAYASVPTLIYYVVSGTCISGSLYECALLLTISIFICARVVLTRKLHSEGACDAVKCIEMIAAKREIELNGDDALLACIHEVNNEVDNIEEIEAEEFENYTMDLPLPESNEEEND